MREIKINHWNVITSLLDKKIKPSKDQVILALEKDPVIKDSRINELILSMINGDKGVFDGTTKRLKLIPADVAIKILKQDYGEQSATDFKANVCEKYGISHDTLKSQLEKYKKFLLHDTQNGS
ncbi:hypothetical protein [Paraglaciecola sp.]|uniref:hypothetical protein n=1 Tax=Paraglaciecola sp. TaxID=1920173 RepID=UPI003EF30289